MYLEHLTHQAGRIVSVRSMQLPTSGFIIPSCSLFDATKLAK